MICMVDSGSIVISIALDPYGGVACGEATIIGIHSTILGSNVFLAHDIHLARI